MCVPCFVALYPKPLVESADAMIIGSNQTVPTRPDRIVASGIANSPAK